MGTNAITNVGKDNLPAFPYEQNNKSPAVLVGAIVSDGEVVGYLPLKVEDNGDGTCTLITKAET